MGEFRPHPNPVATDLKAENAALKRDLQKLRFVARAAQADADSMKAELATSRTHRPVLLLDPLKVIPNPWVSRRPEALQGRAFSDLKEGIGVAGGNVQPVKVRPLKGHERFEYELVFGFLRYRACLELGLPLLSLIEDISTEELFLQMFAENCFRRNPTLRETGTMYRRALDSALFISPRRLAMKLGIPKEYVEMALSLAGLPNEVHEALEHLGEIPSKSLRSLVDVCAMDRDGVIARARSAKLTNPRGTRRLMLQLILGTRPD